LDYQWSIRSYKDKTKSRKNDDWLSLITAYKNGEGIHNISNEN